MNLTTDQARQAIQRDVHGILTSQGERIVEGPFWTGTSWLGSKNLEFSWDDGGETTVEIASDHETHFAVEVLTSAEQDLLRMYRMSKTNPMTPNKGALIALIASMLNATTMTEQDQHEYLGLQPGSELHINCEPGDDPHIYITTRNGQDGKIQETIIK